MNVDPSRVIECADAQAFERWLRVHGEQQPEVWIKLHKVRSGLASITAGEAVDVALCWGWIDAIRKGFDAQSFLQRYTPRGKRSVWSKVNVGNVERLTQQQRMQPAGLAQIAAAKADGRWDRAYRTVDAPPADLLAAIAADPQAQAMYSTLTAQNRFALTFRTITLKTEAGRQNKIAQLVAMLRKGESIHPNGRAAARTPKP